MSGPTEERSAAIAQIIVVRPGDVLVFTGFRGGVDGSGYLEELKRDAGLAVVATFENDVSVADALGWYRRNQAAGSA